MAACRNIEIKAHVTGNVLERMNKITDETPEVIDQVDYFFNVTQGRLKLRFLKNTDRWELICYDRPDCGGPKLSDYRKVDVPDGLRLLEVLKHSLGVRGEVKKRRLLFLHGQTRIHYDTVDNLGVFMELEVMLREDQTVEEGTKIANDILDKLQITEENFITGAYIDLLSVQEVASTN